MHTQLQKIGDGLGLVLTPEEAEALNLSEGDSVEVKKVAAPPAIQYATTEEVLAAYKRTEPHFAETYQELGK